MPLPVLDDPASAVGAHLAGGGVIGFLIGFTAKKLAKVLAVIVGLELALLKFLESRQILMVDWNRLSAGLLSTQETAMAGQPPSWLMSLATTASLGAGFTGGFLLGFKKA